MPYAEIGIGAIILILLGAVIWAFYKYGGERATAAKDVAEAALKADREVQDAVDQARRDPVVVDRPWLQRGGGPPPADPGGTPPPDH